MTDFQASMIAVTSTGWSSSSGFFNALMALSKLLRTAPPRSGDDFR